MTTDTRAAPHLAKLREALTFADLPQSDFIAITVDGDSFSPLWIDFDVINLKWATDRYGRAIVSLYDGKTVARLIESAKQAATLAERERCAKVCDEHAAGQHSLYKGRPPYKGNEPGRADPCIDGRSDGADWCADKIRSGE